MTVAGSQRPSFWPKKIQCRTFGASVFCLYLAQDVLKHVQLSVCGQSGIESHCLTRISLVPPSGTFGCFGMEFSILEFSSVRKNQWLAGLRLSSTLVSHSIGALYLPCIPSAAPHAGAFFIFFTVSLLASCHWMWWNENVYCRC